MEVDRQRTLHAASFAIVVVTLVAICAGLAAMIVITTRGAREAAEGPKESYYYRMAWLSLALLALTVIVFVWVIIHHISGRLARKSPRQTTAHVDAWALAGKRFKLEEDEDSDEEEEPP